MLILPLPCGQPALHEMPLSPADLSIHRLILQFLRGGSLVLLLCAMLTSGCASLPSAQTAQVGERHVEYVQAGEGYPVVVFENGLGGTMDWWAKVLPEIAAESTTFAYNRPGYGRSDLANTPRDGGRIVEELRSLLKNRGMRPPYVLVGHSMGGLYMQFFARQYPGEVAGLVLVDSTHPDQLKGVGARENWSAWTRVVVGVLASEAAKAELDRAEATGVAVLAMPPLAGKPVVVLSALKPLQEKSELADDANSKRKDIVRLHPGARQVWVDSGHAIPLESPEAVITAIRDVLNQSNAARSDAMTRTH